MNQDNLLQRDVENLLNLVSKEGRLRISFKKVASEKMLILININ